MTRLGLGDRAEEGAPICAVRPSSPQPHGCLAGIHACIPEPSIGVATPVTRSRLDHGHPRSRHLLPGADPKELNRVDETPGERAGSGECALVVLTAPKGISRAEYNNPPREPDWVQATRRSLEDSVSRSGRCTNCASPTLRTLWARAPCRPSALSRPTREGVELHNDAPRSFSAADGVTRVAPRLACLSFVASLVLRMSRFATCG